MARGMLVAWLAVAVFAAAWLSQEAKVGAQQARKTVWDELPSGAQRGLGQRIFATDVDEVPLMGVRTISLTGTQEETTDPADAHG